MRTRRGGPLRAAGDLFTVLGPVDSGVRRLLGVLGAVYRFVVLRAAVLVVLGWIAAAIAVPLLVPATSSGAEGLGDLLPGSSPALSVQRQSLATFSVPVVSEITVVVRHRGGLTPLTRADVIAKALSVYQDRSDADGPAPPGRLVGAVPVPMQTQDTAASFLYVSGGTSLGQAQTLAEQYAAHFHNQPGVETYVTGLVPGQLAQSDYVTSRLDLFAVVSVLVVGLVVALAFRSLVAPVAVLAVAGIGYLVTRPLLGVLSTRLGFALPNELEPLIVALLLGVVTDYNVLFLSRLRTELATTADKRQAVRAAVRQEAVIILVAGLTVAGGLLALLAADLELFRSFGPALAFTVLFGLAVALTLTPALMALFGRRLFRPLSGAAPRPVQLPPRAALRASLIVRGVLRVVTNRASAALTTVVLVAGLLALAIPALGMHFDLSFTSGLPASDPARRGAIALQEAGIRGVMAPIEVVLRGQGVGGRHAQLARLQDAVSHQPDVAFVVGPGSVDLPVPQDFGVLVSKDGNAARIVTVLTKDPLAADAIGDFRSLRERLPALAAQAGLGDMQLQLTGQTAVAEELATHTRHNLRVTLLAALAVQLVILFAYLRSLVAPIALLFCSALGVAATLGLTVLVFQNARHDPGLAFYVPFATAVLLLALGADYNVFSVGTVWDEARRRPLAEALRVAVPRSSRAVTAAGFILAATFAGVALIPLESFREIAFTMAVGLLIDTVLVRPVLTPAVLTVLGRVAGWPTNRIRTGSDAQEVAAR